MNRIVHGPGTTLPEVRARAFTGAAPSEPLQPLLDRVARRSAQLSDLDFARAARAGTTDDEIFELVICTAIGHATRQYEAGLAALTDPARVAAVLNDLDSAPIEEGLKAALTMLGTLPREGTLRSDDIKAVLSADVSPPKIEDALAVGFVFNTIGRLANAFDFEFLSPEGFDAGAKYLLKRGYK